MKKLFLSIILMLFISPFSYSQEKAGFEWLTYTTCTSDSTQFLDTSSSACGMPISYRWNFDDPGSGVADSSILQNPKHLFSTTGTFNVQLIVDWACSFVDTMILPITIISGTVPVAKMVSVVSPACDGFVLYTQGGTSGSFPRTSYWDFGDGNTSALTFIPYTYASSGIYNVYHAVTNACGTDTVYKTLLVPKAPSVGFTKNVSDTICAGTTVTFTDTSSSTALPFTYNWVLGSQGISKSQNPSFAFNYAEKAAIVQTVTDTNGCFRTATDTIVIIADTNLASFTFTEGCPCSDINFTATGTATNLQWEFGDNTTSTSSIPTHSYNNPETYIVTLTGTATNGCLYKNSKVISVCTGEILSSIDKSKSDVNWVFSNKRGFDFSSGVPAVTTPVFDGSQEPSIAVSSPTSGKLLFYTSMNFVGSNNWRIIDASNNIMQNSDSIAGDHDSPQGGMVIPFPGDSNKYYFIGNSSGLGYNKYSNAITYSIIDMTLNSGLGAVTAKNIVLDTSMSYTTECMSGMESVAPTCSTNASYWVGTFVSEDGFGITNAKNFGLHLYHFSDTGIGKKVIPLSDYKNIYYSSTTVTMKFSPDGRKIALPHSDGVYVYDFDKLTGDISNLRIIELGQVAPGIEFSPNSNILYVSSFGLHQYDLLANDINASRLTLDGSFYHGINRGLDDKLYTSFSASNDVSVINNPNVVGLGCNFVLNSIPLGAQFGSTTFQNIVPLTVPQDTINAYFTTTVNCSNSTFTNLSFLDTCSYAFANSNFVWDFGDGTTSTNYQPMHTYTTSGFYDVELIVSKSIACIADTFVQTIYIDSFPIVNITSDTNCFGNATNLISTVSNVKNPPIKYQWSSNPTALNDTTANVSHVFSSSVSNEVVLTITDTAGCSYSDTNAVIINEMPVAFAGPDTILCNNTSVVLNGGTVSGTAPINYTWSPSQGLNNNTISNPIAIPTESTIYSLQATNECGIDSASVTIETQNCELYIPNAFSPNGDGLNDIFQIRGDGVKNYYLAVYNRWGDKVFESKLSNSSGVSLSGVEGWDGANDNSGVYVYRLNVTMIDNQAIEKKGNITLFK